ncbi:MAG: ABC transporter permease [Chloroflexi bacterium]|nr:ABC transporter permease [Chloroflexota bacterium]
MLRLAFRNLFQNRVRLVISVGGVALALLLILSMDAIMVGTEEQITAYIDNSGADVFVSQSGVRNLHMASSSLPGELVDRVKAVPGVVGVTPILYLSNVVAVGADRHVAYVIGLPRDAQAGGPWRIAEGVPSPASGEAIVDRQVARKSDVGIGDRVKILGQEFAVAGLAEGTANLVNSIAFVTMEDFVRMRGAGEAVSFLLVQVGAGETPDAVAERIEREVGRVTAQSRVAFAEQERRVVRDMSTDIIAIMNLVGFLIGLAVMALTVYTATFARRAEYGVLKALGAGNGHLYRAVLLQALFSVALGFAVGLACTLLLSAALPRLGLTLALQVSAASLLKVGGASLAIAGLSAILPITQIAGLDPAMVFRGK